MNNDEYIKKLKRLIKLIGPSNKETWILTGSMVLYLLNLSLKDTEVLNTSYRTPNDIDLLCTPDFYNSIIPKNYKEKSLHMNYPKIGKVDFYLCQKTDLKLMKKSILFEDLCYYINIEDLLLLKKKDLNNNLLTINNLKIDIIFISKLLLLKFMLKNKKELNKDLHIIITQQLQQ